MVTLGAHLPTEEELTVQEVNLSIAALRAGAFHLGKYCEYDNNEFMLCREELQDPRKCINEGKAVTACALDFFRKVKKSCHDEFTQYAHCIDQSSSNQQFQYCRKTQAALDKCMLDNYNLERPELGYFCRVKVHDSKRPRPPPEGPTLYPDATGKLPPPAEGEEFPRARYGARYLY